MISIIFLFVTLSIFVFIETNYAHGQNVTPTTQSIQNKTNGTIITEIVNYLNQTIYFLNIDDKSSADKSLMAANQLFKIINPESTTSNLFDTFNPNMVTRLPEKSSDNLTSADNFSREIILENEESQMIINKDLNLGNNGDNNNNFDSINPSISDSDDNNIASNTPPMAQTSFLNVAKNSQLTFKLSGTDDDDDQLVFIITNQPSNGKLIGINPIDRFSSTFTYIPRIDYVGVDSFTYEVSDGTTTSDQATVTLTVE